MRKASSIKIGKNIQKIRKSNGYTQEKLAENSGISRVALSAIENGTIPNGYTMINISKALDKKVEDIFYDDN